MSRQYTNKEWIGSQFLVLKKNQCEIAKMCRCSQPTIVYWLNKFQILLRSKSEAARIARSNHVTLSDDLLEFLNGELLGDGHLTRYKWSASVCFSVKHRSHLEWLSKVLAHYGINQSGRILRRESWHRFPGSGKKLRHDITFYYGSRRYVELNDLQNRWYRSATKKERAKGRKFFKVIPPDLKLTPLICRQWYIGDGSLSKDCGYVTMCTNDFTINEVKLLVRKIRVNGLLATYQRYNNTIRIPKAGVKDFLNYIGPCPIKCYEYKWNLN